MTVVPNIIGLEVAMCLHQVLPKLTREKISLVVEAYSERWRTYHNLSHIWGMVQSAQNQFRSLCSDEEWRALLTMIIFHDVVYKVGDAGKDNERASADMMADMLNTMNESLWFELCVWAGIYATKTHSLEGVSEQYRNIVSMIIDLDLEGLGLSAEKFTQNTESIWHEFEPITTREKYDRGREQWARSFLVRPHIYLTDLFKAQYEASARRNLELLLR